MDASKHGGHLLPTRPQGVTPASHLCRGPRALACCWKYLQQEGSRLHPAPYLMDN